MGRNNNNLKGILSAVLSSATFGFAPFFTLLLIGTGLSSFEVLTYRWGVAALTLGVLGLMTGHSFRVSRRDFGTICLLGLLRAITSFTLIIAYQYIASGVASTIHFLYPLVVACGMALFFHERISWRIGLAIFLSLVGTAFLSGGDLSSGNSKSVIGLASACVSVLAYGGYMIGIKKTRAAQIDSTALTFYVMAFGAALFCICGFASYGSITLVTDGKTWLYILGLALPATAISNITLVQAIKFIGPTRTSLFGAMEPLTAMIIGISVFSEQFTLATAAGMALALMAVTMVVLQNSKIPSKSK